MKMSTFVEVDNLGSQSAKNALDGLDLEALAKAGDEPSGLVEQSKERKTQSRRATVRRTPRMNMYRPNAMTVDDETASVHSHQRRGEISAEPTTQNGTGSPYRKTLVAKDDQARHMIRSAVDSCLLFSELSVPGRNELVDAFHKIEATKGQLLIEEGEWGDLFFVLQHGSCEAVKLTWKPELNDMAPARVKTYEVGGSFGELALMYNEPRAATIRVTSNKALLWAVDRMTFKNISVHFKVLRQKMYEDALKRIPAIRLLSSDEVGRLVDSVEEHSYSPNQTIFQKGEMGSDAIVIIEGKANYMSDSEHGVASPGDVFGAEALIQPTPRTQTLQTGRDQTCVTVRLSKLKMEDAIGGALSPEKINSLRNRPVSVQPPKQQVNHRHHIAVKFEDLDMQLGVVSSTPNANTNQLLANGTPPAGGHSSGRFFRSDTVNSATTAGSKVDNGLKREIVLGVGTFGKVIIVRHTQTLETYAMKRLNKSWIVENSLEQHVVDERNVMTLTDHPFILKLHNSYYDERYVYLLLELCLGGELFMYLRKHNRFNEQQARFYAASITFAFEHLHSKSIIYRDLKPENLMLDDVGFLKVVDFGLAKVVKGRTWTICGTPEYLAPEVVLSKGHNRGVDYWALGVLIFELTAGYCPFVGDDNMQIYKLIVENKIEFPPHTTPLLRDIVRDFTKSSQLVRLGLRRPGTKAIREHPWFTGFDWSELEALKMTPPIPTKVRHKTDISNFEEYQGSEQDEADAVPCAWRPNFPYEVIDGRTVLSAKHSSMQ